MNISGLQWTVSMIGSRRHYASARALHRLGVLQLFYTDVWCRYGRAVLRHGPGAARRLAGRYDPSLPPEKVKAFNLQGIIDSVVLQRWVLTGHGDLEEFFSRQGARFARRVAEHMRRTGADRREGVFLGFSDTARETLEVLRESPQVTVVDQFHAAGEHLALLAAEYEKWPGWEIAPAPRSDSSLRRWEEEWKLCDVVLVSSEWTKGAIVRQGVPAEKIAVGLPAYEPPTLVASRTPRLSRKLPLRVLWVGRVSIGKGIQYLIDAAKAVEKGKFQFTVVGPVAVTSKAIDAAPMNMRFVGQVPRHEVPRYYHENDVYVLPTVSDNWPMAQLEAMAYGLPVIITTSSGTAVDHGKDGLVVPAADSHALRSALELLEGDRDLLSEMSKGALRKSRQFTLERSAERLISQVQSVVARTR